MSVRGAGFTNLEAAATFGTGYIFIDQYQQEILDTVRRGGVLGQRIRNVPATGQPSRWMEQTAIGSAAFDAPTALNPTATGPTRGEKALTIKAIDNMITFGLFNQQVSSLMPSNLQVQAKDMADMISGVQVLHDTALWTGTDAVAGALVGDGTTNQYVGVPKQISTPVVYVDSTSSIVDGIRQQVALLVSSAADNIMPTAIYLNPMAHFAIEQEMIQNDHNMNAQVEVVPGVKVRSIMTAAGPLPLIADPLLAKDPAWAVAAPAGQSNYPVIIVTEKLIEYHWVGSETAQVYQLGTTSNLSNNFIGVKFGAPVVKAGDRAHKRICVRRVTFA